MTHYLVLYLLCSGCFLLGWCCCAWLADERRYQEWREGGEP